MMQNTRFKLSALAIATAMACSPAAFATNGYFLHGIGTKADGMGGVGIALPQDGLAAATNPAGMSWTGSRADAGLMLFNPRRDASVDATGMDATNSGMPNVVSSPGMSSSDDSGATLFLVPNAGFAMDMAGMTVGLAMYGNGGMNTRYNQNIYANAFGSAIGSTTTLQAQFNGGVPSDYSSVGFAGALEQMGLPTGSCVSGTGIDGSLCAIGGDGSVSSTLGVNLSQLIFAPSVSAKISKDHSVGASLLVGYQRFRAYGLGLFKSFSQDPNNVTNKGDDDAWGGGVRLGWTGKFADSVMVGATYSSKIYMQKFDQYKGLFAEQGRFDIPSNYGLGISFKPVASTTVAFDVTEILYGDVPAIANPGPTPDQFIAGLAHTLSGGAMTCANLGVTCNQMGSDNGYGFGWENQTVYKLGVDYAYNDQWTLRAGVNYGKSPIPDNQNLLNVVAPGVVETHATLGFTYAPVKNNEISVAYMHAFRKDQSYTYNNASTSALVPNGFGPQSYDANIGMSENSLEVSYGIKF
jgi:long-chain fatty acid transport protein